MNRPSRYEMKGPWGQFCQNLQRELWNHLVETKLLLPENLHDHLVRWVPKISRLVDVASILFSMAPNMCWTGACKHFSLFNDWTTIMDGFVSIDIEQYSLLSLGADLVPPQLEPWASTFRLSAASCPVQLVFICFSKINYNHYKFGNNQIVNY